MRILLEKIYFSLPLMLQNIAISIFGLYWYNRRFGGVFINELQQFKKREYFSVKEWRSYQEYELRKLLLHAWKTVPYYSKLFNKIGLTEDQIRIFRIKDISILPALDKKVFKELGLTEMLSLSMEPHGEILHSSGSTGTPTKVLYSRRMHQKYFAIFEATVNNWAGLNYKVPRGVVGGRRIIQHGVSDGSYYRYNLVERQVYFSAYHISAKTVRNYLEGMKKHKVEYMTGYASSNYFLARFIEEEGLEAPKLRAVLTSSEKLTSEMRDTFRRVYGCETFDSYNGVDLCNLISECEYHRLHIIPDVGIVEVLNQDGQPCQPGEIGEVISTGLMNFDQPLIRYRIGDYVKLSKEQTCPCGRNMTVVDEIVGRIEDTVIGFDGREMMRFHGIFINISCIVEGQIIQHDQFDFEIKLVVSHKPDELDLALIRKRMISQLGEIKLIINLVDQIPKSANGKFKAVISHLDRDRSK